MQQATSVSDLTIANRTLVMGIVNVTEDSFSDGGKWLDVDAAINHARELVAQGADMIDVGGESTRPGAWIPCALRWPARRQRPGWT